MARIDKIEVVEKEIPWADRKRILGMPISFTRYSIDEERLYVKKGLLRTELNEILLYRILDVRSTQTLWQRIFGVGTLTLYSADQSCPQLLLKKYPESCIVLTLGSRGCIYQDKSRRLTVAAKKVKAVDTTAAGDTFSGFFIAGIAAGESVEQALEEATKAAAISVSRMGASVSIPTRQEMLAF